MTAAAASDTEHDALSSTSYVLVSTDGHVGPSLTGQLREYCPKEYFEDFDAYAAANAGPVAFVKVLEDWRAVGGPSVAGGRGRASSLQVR